MRDDPPAGFAPSLDVATWLVSDAGLEALAAVVAALDAGEDELTVAARLRAGGTAPDRARGLLDAAHARRRARGRYPDADAIVLTTTALEQASHPAAAATRAARFAGAAHVTDLCSGVGGDALAIATRVAQVTAVDHDAARLALLRHNAAVRGLEVRTVVGDVLRHPVEAGGLVHVDPGRRAGGRRLRRLGELLPPVPDLVAHLSPAAGTGIVLSPAVDLADPGLPPDAELEFVQLDRQLLEATCWLADLRRPGAVATATLLPDGPTVSRDGPATELPVGPVAGVLLEPRPAAVRARVADALGEEVGARRVARRRALLTADEVPDSPWFEPWIVEAQLPLRPKAISRWLRAHDPRPVEIATHGVDADPQTWWRRLGRPPRGPQGRRLHLVRLDDGAACLIGHRPD